MTITEARTQLKSLLERRIPALTDRDQQAIILGRQGLADLEAMRVIGTYDIPALLPSETEAPV